MYENFCSDFYSDIDNCVYAEELADDDFDARINCCSCGGGTTYDPEPEACSDTDNGATDNGGDGCDWYTI